MKGVVREEKRPPRKRWVLAGFVAGTVVGFGLAVLIFVQSIEKVYVAQGHWSVRFENRTDLEVGCVLQMPVSGDTDSNEGPLRITRIPELARQTGENKYEFELEPGAETSFSGRSWLTTPVEGAFPSLWVKIDNADGNAPFRVLRGVQVLDGAWDCIIEQTSEGELRVSYVAATSGGTWDPKPRMPGEPLFDGP